MFAASPDQEPVDKPVILAFEEINIFDALPEYTLQMPDGLFQKWAKAYNEAAHRRASQRAEDWMIRNPAMDVFVQENDYDSSSTLSQSESANSNGATVDAVSSTKYNGTSIQRTYRDRDRWGGGPVVIINPYARRSREVK
jgi:hypothetical protein